jgi:threonine/homoserine/homoserine lactone efflux protein
MAPGPSLAVILRCTARAGRRAGLVAALAHAAAIGCYAALTVSGLALALQRSPGLFTAVQTAGAIWLLYLGLNGLRQWRRGALANLPTTAAIPQSLAQSATEGFLVAFLNPKVGLFMVALFSQFLPASPGVATQALMTATVMATDAAWYCLVAFSVSRPRWLAILRRRASLVDQLLNTLLAALGAAMLLHLARQALAG